MSKKKRRKIYRLYITAALVAVVAVLVRTSGSDGLEVSMGYPQPDSITETIPSNGRIHPVTEVKISPDVSGEIVELNVEEGDRVCRGDLLIKIKQDVYISAVDRAEASLNSARAQCEQQEAAFQKSELSYERNRKLYSLQAISQSEYEASESEHLVSKGQLTAARYNVRSAEASLKEAQENLVKTTIYSPMDGVVSKLSVEKGERVVGTSQMAGTEMLRIADMDKMEVLVDVNENDILRLSEGDTASISVDAYPGRTFAGVVTKIASSAKNIGSATEQVTNFEVRVAVLQSSYSDLYGEGRLPFKPGMSASVSIVTEKRDGVLTVPLQSVTSRTDIGGDSSPTGEYVFVVNDSLSTVRAVPVRTGIQDLEKIEICEGLTEADHIVTGPYSLINKTLKSGDKVSEPDDEEKDGENE